MGKTKEKSTAESRPAAAPKEEKPLNYDIDDLTPMAKPLGSKKLLKKALKVVKKASAKKNIRRGVKEVVKALRKGQKGFVLIAGDISPVDVISHLPILCEDNAVPYFFVPSKLDLGLAASTKRPTSVILVTDKGISNDEVDYKEHYEAVQSEASQLKWTD